MKERVHGHVMWKCICDCGVETIVRGGSLRDGNTESCGCLKSKVRKNNKYGKLTTIERAKVKAVWRWRCLCECGKESFVMASNLLTGNTRSCGCIRTNENMSDSDRRLMRAILATDSTPHYSTWRRHVMERDGYTCVLCGHEHSENYDMIAHHLDGFDWCEERWVDVDNGVALCSMCHTDFHKKYGSGGNTEEQFNEFKRLKNNNFCTYNKDYVNLDT